MKIGWLQRSQFSEHCDYLIFSKGSKMTNFIRGTCASNFNTLESLDNNIYFSDREDDHMLNRRFNKDQQIDLHNGISKAITMLADFEYGPTKLACFTEFNRQAW